jgi:hypothetical protein
VIRVTAPPPSRTPVRTVAQPATARAALRYALVVVAGLVLLLVLVAGCGAAPLPPAAPSTIAPTTPAAPPPPTTVAPTTTPSVSPDATEREAGGRDPAAPAPQPHAAPTQGTGGRAPAPIWPAADAASARNLQNQVDGGRQPWLLDPTEVAVSYAGAVLGYRNPGVFPTGAGRVDVQDGRSPAKATITLGQTVRRGDGGIWLVTGVQKR